MMEQDLFLCTWNPYDKLVKGFSDCLRIFIVIVASYFRVETAAIMRAAVTSVLGWGCTATSVTSRLCHLLLYRGATCLSQVCVTVTCLCHVPGNSCAGEGLSLCFGPVLSAGLVLLWRAVAVGVSSFSYHLEALLGFMARPHLGLKHALHVILSMSWCNFPSRAVRCFLCYKVIIQRPISLSLSYPIFSFLLSFFSIL